MTTKLKVVFDSNVYIAAALNPGQHADRWLDIAVFPGSGLQIYVSTFILSEVEQTLVNRFGFDPGAVKVFLKRIKAVATLIPVRTKLNVVPDDSDDNAIIACAIDAKAHLIITADHHLLKLNPYEGIGIAQPRELKRIFAQDYQKYGDKPGNSKA